MQWIQEGPLLQKPIEDPIARLDVPVTYPIYSSLRPQGDIPPVSQPPPLSNPSHDMEQTAAIDPSPDPINDTESSAVPPETIELRRSKRKRKAPDFLRPKFHGKVYAASTWNHLPRKQRVPAVWEYLTKQRTSQPEVKIKRLNKMKTESGQPTQYQSLFRQYRQYLKELRHQRFKSTKLPKSDSNGSAHSLTTNQQLDPFQRPMPPSTLPPIYPTGPLNLNSDGTTITYKKSHQGIYADHWAQADSEEMERLFRSGTLRPIHHGDIPADKKATYVNPVCSEKLKDDGSLKLRTRATIGGDRIDYPYSTTAITAELESIKIPLDIINLG